MKTILSNRKNALNAQELISLAAEKSSDVELFLDGEMLRRLNPATNGDNLNALINCFQKHRVNLAGICIETGLNSQEDSLTAKSAIQLLRRFNGGYIRLTPLKGEQFEPGKLTGFLNLIARFAAYRTGGGEGEGPVVVSHCPPEGLNVKELCNMYKSISYKCSGLSLNECDYGESDLIELTDQFNQCEFSLFTAAVDENISEQRLSFFCSLITKVYDGALIIELSDATCIDRIRDTAEKYTFDRSLYDYSKSSCPSSVTRIIKNHGDARVTPDEVVVACQDITWKYEFCVGAQGIKTGGGIKIQFNHATNMEKIQLENPTGRGYTTIKAPDMVKIRSAVNFEDACVSLGIIIKEGELKPGDIISVIFGDTSKAAPPLKVQTYQCSSFMFYSFVDPTGYGIYFAQKNQPSIKIYGGRPDRLKVFAPVYAKVGEEIAVKIRVDDAYNNVARGFNDILSVFVGDKKLENINIEDINGNSSLKKISGIVFDCAGDYVVTVKGGGLSYESNFISVTETGI